MNVQNNVFTLCLALLWTGCVAETGEDRAPEESTTESLRLRRDGIGECSDGWHFGEPRPYISPAYPDTNAVYWLYSLEVQSDQPIELELRSEFPEARYISLSIYDLETGASVDSLRDYQIEPDLGSANPFRAGGPWILPEHNFTVNLRPAAYATGEANELIWPEPAAGVIHTRHLMIAYRIYLPENQDALQAPGLTVRDPRSGTPAACPRRARRIPPLSDLLQPENYPLFAGTGDDVRFVNLEGENLGANPNGDYLATGFQGRVNQVAVFRFRPPQFPRTADGERPASDDDVRYWSLCLYGANTTVSRCLADEDAIVDPDGYVTVVIGPNLRAIRRAARGANFIPWGLHARQVLLYRHAFPSSEFEGRFSLVPYWQDQNGDGELTSADLDEGSQGGAAADQHLPGGYAPSGRVCSVRTFVTGRCPL